MPLHLVGPHEIRMRLGGISRQRVYEITHYSHFPAPIADLVLGKVWLAEDVEAWIREHRPGDRQEDWPALRPGRPAAGVDGAATVSGG
jgi:predicted DNA-binding transcriptional regulator AlpA